MACLSFLGSWYCRTICLQSTIEHVECPTRPPQARAPNLSVEEDLLTSRAWKQPIEVRLSKILWTQKWQVFWPKGQLPSFIFNAQIRDGGLQLKHPRRRASACSPEATWALTAWTHKSSYMSVIRAVSPQKKVSLIGCMQKWMWKTWGTMSSNYILLHAQLRYPMNPVHYPVDVAQPSMYRATQLCSSTLLKPAWSISVREYVRVSSETCTKRWIFAQIGKWIRHLIWWHLTSYDFIAWTLMV